MEKTLKIKPWQKENTQMFLAVFSKELNKKILFKYPKRCTFLTLNLGIDKKSCHLPKMANMIEANKK